MTTDKSATYDCILCEKKANWIRHTQFAGDHPFCDFHARKQAGFMNSNSYEFWNSLGDEMEEDDFGFSTYDPSSKVEATSVATKIQKIKNKIEPFLNNLAKNPEQDIHWPDRDKKIAKFKRELWAIIDEV